MRENMGLYRGKRTYNGEWVEGALLVWPDGTTWILVYNPTEDWMDRYEVDPSTVGEDTGLTDKNGKRIFEGDVVSGLFLYALPINGVCAFFEMAHLDLNGNAEERNSSRRLHLCATWSLK